MKMPRMDKLSNYKTTITGSNGKTIVTYQTTQIVVWDNVEITLNSGGWETVTTKRKMNQTANQFGLGYSVFQKNHVWFVKLPNCDIVPFVDGMKFGVAL